MKCMGWTPREAAIAKARHEAFTGEVLSPDLNGLAKLREFWIEHGFVEPGEVMLEGVSYKADTKWAAETFYNAAMELGHFMYGQPGVDNAASMR